MTATLHESWATSDPESDLDDKFGHSLVTRAKKRKVIQPGTWAHNRFLVMGDPKLGDAYDDYTVSFDGRKYHCSCREHAHGEFRKLCSHALAVMLYRKQNRNAIGGVGGSAADSVPPPSGHAVADADSLHLRNTADPTDDVLDPAIPSPSDEMWGQPPLPSWVSEIRNHQWPAVERIVSEFDTGARVVWLDAPVGSGKTLVAELVRRLLKTNALYVCSTKSLQEQAMRDFPYAKLLKGRANYPTADDPDAFEATDRWGTPQLTAADCTKQMAELPACAKCPPVERSATLHCNFCHPVGACEYEKAKIAALSAELTILNTSYFMAEANGPGKFSAYKKDDPHFGLVVIDECDLLEGELMGQVEVRVTEATRKKYGIEPPAKKTVESAWVEWVDDEAIPKVERAIKKTPTRSDDVKVVRERQRLERLLGRLRILSEELGDAGWVADDWERDGAIVFRPIKVDRFGEAMLWRHGVRFLCMSGTILSAELLSDSLGLKQ